VSSSHSGRLIQDTVGAEGTQTEGVGVGVVADVNVDVASVEGSVVVTGALIPQSRL